MPIQTMTNQAGERYVLENGQYRPITQAEATTLDRGTLDVAAEAAVNLGKAVGYTMGGLMRTGYIGDPFSGTKQALEAQAPLSEMRPGASAIGIEGPLSIMGMAGTRLAQGARATQRIARANAAKAARPDDIDTQRITPEVSQTVEDLGHTVDTMQSTVGADSAGAAARTDGLWTGLRRMPKFKDFLENLEGLVATPKNLTDGQQQMLDSGLADKVGFQFLPGQRNGNGVIAEAIRRDPAMSDAFDHILAQNSNNLLERSARSMNLDPGAYGRDIRYLGRESVGEQFNEVESQIGQFDIPEDVRKVLDDEVFTTTETRAMEGVNTVGGRDAMDVRRLLVEELSAARSDPTLSRRARTLEQSLESYDDALEGAIDDPGVLDTWRDARARWRVVRAFDRPGVITRDGDISVKSLVGALEREFVTEFRRSELPRGDLPDDVVDLLEYTRVAGNFASNLNDSGTATGNAVINMINNPVSYGKKRLAARFIADYMLSRPDIAQAMPD